VDALHENSEHVLSDFESNPDDSNVSQLSIKFSELNEKCIEMRNQANNEILFLKHTIDEANMKIMKLEKLLIKSKNDITDVVLNKNKEITKISNKLMEAEKRIQQEDKRSQLILKKKIWALKWNLSKLESGKNKLEEKLRQVESELETEKIVNRKLKAKDKSESTKASELTMRLTKTIDTLQNKIKLLQKEKKDILDKSGRKIKNKTLKPQKKYTKNAWINSRRNSTSSHVNLTKKRLNNIKSRLLHSQSNDALLLKCKNREKSKDKSALRDLSCNSKKSNIPQLNLSEITQGSPVSTNRVFSTRSNRRLGNNPTNTSTTNISFLNSFNGVFKNSVVGAQGDGSSKYWAACKFKEWKKKQLNYDVEQLVKNRDMFRSVQCLGCNVQFEVKYFLDHVRSCRLAYNIPWMVQKDEVFARMSYNNHKYFTNKKRGKSPASVLHESINLPVSKIANEASSPDEKDLSVLSNGNRVSSSLFSKLRKKNFPTERANFALQKVRTQKLLASSNESYLRNNSDFLSSSLHGEKGQVKKQQNKNNRYNKEYNEEDSDEPDVPNENVKDYSIVDLDKYNEDNEWSSLSQYQTVPRSMNMMKSSEKNLMDSWENLKENMMDPHLKLHQNDRYSLNSPHEKMISPIMKSKEDLTPEIEVHNFEIEAISEFEF
jgi:hypothetical protein